jgi:hypothetical protein
MTTQIFVIISLALFGALLFLFAMWMGFRMSEKKIRNLRGGNEDDK